MDEVNLTALLSKPNVEVACAAGAPEKALMRRDFAARSEAGHFGALVTAIGSALVAVLIGSLVLSRKFGWLSRQIGLT